MKVNRISDQAVLDLIAMVREIEGLTQELSWNDFEDLHPDDFPHIGKYIQAGQQAAAEGWDKEEESTSYSILKALAVDSQLQLALINCHVLLTNSADPNVQTLEPAQHLIQAQQKATQWDAQQTSITLFTRTLHAHKIDYQYQDMQPEQWLDCRSLQLEIWVHNGHLQLMQKGKETVLEKSPENFQKVNNLLIEAIKEHKST